MDVVVCIGYCNCSDARDQVKADLPAWYPRKPEQRANLTPYQVQRSALVFFIGVGTPAATPDPMEKAQDRPKNYHPTPAHALSGDIQEQQVPKITCHEPELVFAFSFFKVRDVLIFLVSANYC